MINKQHVMVDDDFYEYFLDDHHLYIIVFLRKVSEWKFIAAISDCHHVGLRLRI